MSIEIGQYVEYLLIHRGNVALPGLGSISLVQKPAYFSEGKTKMHPPSLNFQYAEEDVGNNELIEFIVKSEGLESHEVKEDIHKYSQNILNEFLNYDSAKIPNVGIIQKDDSETRFIPNGSFAIRAYDGLQPIGLIPLPKLKLEKPIEDSPPVLKRDLDWITYLGALILGALMIIAYHNFVDPLNSTNTSTRKDIIKTENQLGEDSESPGQNANLENSQIVDKPIDVDLLVPNNQDSVAKQDNLRTNEELSVVPKPYQQQDNKKIPPDTSSINIAKPKKNQKCIILIGVYNKPIEALVMSDRIKANGYIPFRDVKYDANRVGVQFNCSDKDAKEMLEEIKAKFNHDAYYLQPNITFN